MKTLGLILTTTLMMGSAVALQAGIWDDPEDQIAFGCRDVIVVGRLVNGDYHAIEDEEDILGHGWVDARLHVRAVIQGGRVPAAFPVRYVTHAMFREKPEFLFVLRGNKRDGFLIREARLIEARPRLERRCDPEIDS